MIATIITIFMFFGITGDDYNVPFYALYGGLTIVWCISTALLFLDIFFAKRADPERFERARRVPGWFLYLCGAVGAVVTLFAIVFIFVGSWYPAGFETLAEWNAWMFGISGTSVLAGILIYVISQRARKGRSDEELIELGVPDPPGRGLNLGRSRSHPLSERVVTQQAVDGPDELVLGPVVGGHPGTEARLLEALGVVVLIPEERQRDHGEAEVKPLADGVVAAVRDQQIALGKDRRLRQNWFPYIFGPSVIWSLSGPMDTTVRCSIEGHRVDEALHQTDVHAAERPQRQVDDLALTGEVSGEVEGRVAGPYGGLEPVP